MNSSPHAAASTFGRWVIVVAVVTGASPALADPLNCDLSGYQATAGLTAAVTDDLLTLT